MYNIKVRAGSRSRSELGVFDSLELEPELLEKKLEARARAAWKKSRELEPLKN